MIGHLEMIDNIYYKNLMMINMTFMFIKSINNIFFRLVMKIIFSMINI